MSNLIIKAIKKINPNAIVTVIDNDINKINWYAGTTPIPKADIEAQIPTVELEIALNNLRQKRNNLLAKTDYLGVSDQTMSSAMTDYRQALRDLPSGLDTVEKVKAKEFPTKPGA